MLTSTSANHLCNLAREYVTGLKTELQNTKFVSTSVIIDGKPILLEKETNNPNDIITKLETISQANAFVAYFQEAIKVKNDLYSSTQNLSLEEYASQHSKTIPTKPLRTPHKTFKDFFKELTIQEKARYYTLEAEAAAIGKAIHLDGFYHNARQQMFNALSFPAKVIEDKVYQYTPSTTNVNDVYFQLQNKHREAEASLNAIKNSINLKVQEYNTACDLQYSQEYTKYDSEYQALYNEFINWKNQELKRIQKLKIEIPNMHQKMYDFLSNL